MISQNDLWLKQQGSCPAHSDDVVEVTGNDNDDDDDDDIYIMMKCLCVCHDKSSLPTSELSAGGVK